ncbi:MAG: peptidylprolyl isomerase [Planctomycetaceae bacterium]|nr:peptidylprolyl isomerase [Planctomycetaceae bacterium]
MDMKKILIVSLIAVFGMMFFYGCEEAAKGPAVDPARLDSITPPKEMPDMPVPTGGLVLSVESTAVTADELVEPVIANFRQLAKEQDFEHFKISARPMVANMLLQRVADIKLYQKAKAALPEGVSDEVIDKIVEEEVQKFIARCGGNYSEVEKLLAKMGTNWKEFYREQRRAILIQSFISEELKDEKPITHSELLAYYNKIKADNYEQKAQLTFRVIDILPYKLYDANDPNVGGDQKADQLAAEIIGKIKNGEDFNDLAKKYSQDYSAKDGGLWKPVVPGTLAAPYDVIEKAAANMKDGDVSEPIKSSGHIFIVKLIDKKESMNKPFEQVQGEVEARMQLEKRKKVVNDMMDKIIKQVDLTYADQFVEYCLEKAYNDCRAQ